MKKRKYCEVYDCMYGRFGKWLESKCSDKDCEYCSNRPKRHPHSCKCRKRFFDITDIEIRDE